MESNLPLDSDYHALEITSESRGYLLETAKWGRFLAIAGFVFMALFLLFFLFMGGTLMSQMDEIQGQQGGAALGGTFWLIYMVFVFGISFFPLYYLYNFSSKTIRALNSTSTGDLTDGLKNLKSLFKFYGIFMAIVLGFYALAIVGGLLFSIVS